MSECKKGLRFRPIFEKNEKRSWKTSSKVKAKSMKAGSALRNHASAVAPLPCTTALRPPEHVPTPTATQMTCNGRTRGQVGSMSPSMPSQTLSSSKTQSRVDPVGAGEEAQRRGLRATGATDPDAHGTDAECAEGHEGHCRASVQTPVGRPRATRQRNPKSLGDTLHHQNLPRKRKCNPQ